MPLPIVDYRLVIPSKYQIPEEIVEHTLTFIAEKMPKKKTGRPRHDNRPLLAGMYYVLRTGCPWGALPLCFGSAKTVYHRFREFIRFGVFQAIWRIFLQLYDQEKGLVLKHQSVDSNHRKSPLGGEETGKSPVDRRKLGSKIAICVEKNGIPIGASIERSNKSDAIIFDIILNDLHHQISQSYNHFIHGDKGFDSKKNRALAVSYNYTPQIAYRKRKNNSQPENIRDQYRWVVERTFSWLSRFRRLFVRYDRAKSTYLAFLQFAFQCMILKKMEFSD